MAKRTIDHSGRDVPRKLDELPEQRKLITWRLCAFLDYWHASNREMDKPIGDQAPDTFNRARLKWIQSDKIEAPWCTLESQTNPFETVKTLPEGEEP